MQTVNFLLVLVDLVTIWFVLQFVFFGPNTCQNNKFNTNYCRRDRAKAVDILVKDLKVFAAFNEELFKEITQLLTLENFR